MEYKVSGNLGIGCGEATLPELFQAHVILDILCADTEAISETFVELYKKGLSLRDIAKHTGKCKTMVRSHLLKAGIDLRPKEPTSVHQSWREPGKQRIRPYYGFCYFQGKVVPDPREYDNLLLIHRLWRQGNNPNRIADTLNKKKVLGRKSAGWNRNSVVLVLKRFEQGIISIKGDQYELR